MKLDFCVSHNYTQRENKMQEKTGHAQNILPVMTTSEQGLFRSRDWRHFRSKRPHWGVYCATSGCGCAEHTSGQGTWLTSLLVTSFPVAPPHSTIANTNWAVPIYYYRVNKFWLPLKMHRVMSRDETFIFLQWLEYANSFEIYKRGL